MKKILFIVTKSENGGAQKWIKEQIEILQDNHELFIVTDEDGWLVKNTNVKSTLTSKNIYKRFSLYFFKEFVNFVKLHNIDLVIASSANAGIYARLLKIFNKKCKIIYVSHGWSSIYNGGILTFLFKFIELQLSKLSDSILCISSSDYNKAKDIIKIKEDKLKLISNKIFPMKERVQRKDKKIKILTVARLRYPKRVDLLIKSLADLNVELYVVGDGPLMQKLEPYKSFENIHFLGEVDEFSDFKSYDVFALISESEGLPLSAIEAMSAGLPLILSDVGGCSELIKDNGVLVKNSIEEIYHAINECIQFIDTYSNNSRIYFEKKYNLEKNKEIYVEYYKKYRGVPRRRNN